MPLAAAEVLEREFLEIRAKILEIAAALDRMNRANGSIDGDPRLTQIRRGLAVLQGQQQDRAEQVQLIFSLPYDENWQETLGVNRNAEK
jgi:hypothetical protein